MNRTSKVVTLCFASAIAFSSTVACGGGDGPGEPVAQSVDQGLVASVPAGAKSRASGVEHWKLGHDVGKLTIDAVGANDQSLANLRVHSTVDRESGLRRFHLESAEGELGIDEKGVIVKNTLSPRGHLALQNLTEDVNRYKASNPVAYDCAADVILFVGALGLSFAAYITPEPLEPVACVSSIVVVLGAWQAVITDCGLVQ